MSDMGDASLRDIAQGLSKASVVLSKTAVAQVMKLCEILKVHLRRKAATLIAKSSGRPVLYSYSCDGTPMRASVRISSEAFAPHTTQDRRGKHCVEFLLQRGWYKTFGSSGEAELVPILGDPRPMTHGKSIWHFFAAAREFAPLLQEMGHTGVSISHCTFDRGIFSGLARRLAQRSELHHQQQQATNATHFAVSPRLLDWQVATGCAMHDAHNGLKWALSASLPSADIIRDLHIVVESLGNYVSELSSHLHAFVRESVAFDNRPYDRDMVYEFWVALGIGTDVLEVLVDLNPWFSGSRLWVASTWEDHEHLTETLTRVCLYLLKLKRFTESRWCTAGSSCRALVGCLAIGLDQLVAVCRRDPQSSG